MDPMGRGRPVAERAPRIPPPTAHNDLAYRLKFTLPAIGAAARADAQTI
jgi:hypothetical protein